MYSCKCLIRSIVVLWAFCCVIGLKFDHQKSKNAPLPEKESDFLSFQATPAPDVTEGKKQKFGFLELKAGLHRLKADFKAGLDEEKRKFKAGFEEEKKKFKAGFKEEPKPAVILEPSISHEIKFGFKDVKSKVDDMKSAFVSKLNKENAAPVQPFERPFMSVAPQPICPIRVIPVYEEAFVQKVVHSVATVHEKHNFTVYNHVTETLRMPITVLQRITVTKELEPIRIIETRVVPEIYTVTKAKIVTTNKPVTFTNLEISTVTATNTLTTTKLEPVWVTLTEVQTQWITSTESVVRTSLEWISATEILTQPIYVTTNVWVEAPQLILETIIVTQPHFMTTTEYVTNVVHTTVCNED